MQINVVQIIDQKLLKLNSSISRYKFPSIQFCFEGNDHGQTQVSVWPIQEGIFRSDFVKGFPEGPSSMRIKNGISGNVIPLF